MNKFLSFLGRYGARIRKTYFSSELEFRLRIFNMLALGGISISFLMAVVSVASGSGLPMALLNALSGVLAVLLVYYTNKSRRYQLCYLVTIVLVFLIFFPAMFFIGGGYHSGMPCFFIFAVLFTVFMLDGKRMLLLAGIELAVYAGCCLFAYRNPQWVIRLESEEALLADMLSGFAVVSVVLGTTMYFLLRLYKNQQEKLDRQNEILIQTNRMKTEFISNASHEMKTPLTVISVDVQQAMDIIGSLNLDEGSDKAVDLLQSAQDEVMRLARMVNGMLNLASIREKMEKKTTDYAALLRSCAETWRMALYKKGNILQTEIPGDFPKAFCDADLLAQVLSNLLQNANAHTYGGTVSVRARRDGDKLRVTVRDNGEGIPAALLPKVFERGVSGGGGTGYGLYLCKIIVESHGGEIWLESEEGNGTAAVFTIPIYEGQLGGDTR